MTIFDDVKPIPGGCRACRAAAPTRPGRLLVRAGVPGKIDWEHDRTIIGTGAASTLSARVTFHSGPTCMWTAHISTFGCGAEALQRARSATGWWNDARATPCRG